MLKKIIIIENGEQVQYNRLEEIVKILIDENFYDMDQNKRIQVMRTKALANCINNKREIIQEIQKIQEDTTENLNEVFIIKDEITYILSLLMTNKIIILERKDSNIFSGDLNKENIENNYIIINTYAEELLKKYLRK